MRGAPVYRPAPVYRAPVNRAPVYRAPVYGPRPVVVHPVAAGHRVFVPGYWGFHGGARVWIGGAWAFPPYDGWIWVQPQWIWNGYTWVWSEGHWAPPY
jgi:hypothetical protein